MSLANTKNTSLKGRKRFKADLGDAVEACSNGYEFCGVHVLELREGEEEGSIAFSLVLSGECVISVVLLISDTSEYPKDHTFFASTEDTGCPRGIVEAIESLASDCSRPIGETIMALVGRICKATGGSDTQPQYRDSDAEMEEEEGEEGYEAFDEFDGLNGSADDTKQSRLLSLQRDFIELVAASYRPGFIRFGADDFAVSVSIPILRLTESISPRTLMAWDSRLLLRSQHLTLLITGFRGIYPVIGSNGTYTRDVTVTGVQLSFKVGLSKRYKPSREWASESSRVFRLVAEDAEDELLRQWEARRLAEQERLDDELGEANLGANAEMPEEIESEEEEDVDEGRFDTFSLSSSLQSLLDSSFLQLVQLRKKFGLGWAGAEELLTEVEKSQSKPEDIFASEGRNLTAVDRAESRLVETYNLPLDPLLGKHETDEINLPLTAFSFLLRRLTLVTRYCLVCHCKINTDFEALKPYVCDRKLCSYQYYSLNRGPSLEYEIRSNPGAVDLLVSIAYTAAAEGALEEPLPVGMGLRVPLVEDAALAAQTTYRLTATGVHPVVPPPYNPGPTKIEAGYDGLCDFDTMHITRMRVAIQRLIDSLPSIYVMRKHLNRKVQAGKRKPNLKDLDPTILPAAWLVLRWIVGSCTAYLEEIKGDDTVQGLDTLWRQFRFSVGAPDAEARFSNAVAASQLKCINAQKYPSLYAFHGSSVKNWHSIIRHGLWYKTMANGRAYGDGVYLAKDASVSLGHYASAARMVWRNSKINPVSCAALVEVVNLPEEFVSKNPYFVVKDTHWLMCRYLLVKGQDVDSSNQEQKAKKPSQNIPLVPLDPAHPITMSGPRVNSASKLAIPQPFYQLESLLKARHDEYMEEDHDSEDAAIFDALYPETQSHAQPDFEEIEATSKLPAAPVQRPEDDWQHDREWVAAAVENILPPPSDAATSATLAVQKELRAMLKEQDAASKLSELGWYMPREFIGDNLFQWIVEMHSFDKDLPIAQDLKTNKLNSVIFEIRFPPTFPLAPPFFRILTPRFLPFIQGGGGHVTGGGSICMDLLTSSGWLPSYNISSILLQIKLAIQNPDPRPARLSPQWRQPYQSQEALEGFRRAAKTHGWTVPDGLDRLVR